MNSTRLETILDFAFVSCPYKETGFFKKIPFGSQSLKKTCKGEYTNVHPRNTQCLKFVEEFNKVYTLKRLIYFVVIKDS